MKKLYIILIISFIFIISFLFLIKWKKDIDQEITNTKTTNKISKSEITIIKNNINLGEIPMDEWKVNIPFEFINSWNENISLWDAETTCMCTEAVVTDFEWKNPSKIIVMRWHNFGLATKVNKVLKPWNKAYLVATFDPNAHWPNATWPISRNIYINTNSSITQKLDFRFMWDVVKTRSEVQKQEIKEGLWEKELFEFEEKSFDFWVIKQSWWKVKHDFKFTYNWSDPIKITWVPTSCACTSAIVDKTELQPWETWILTVKFNPNLHEEPAWKFFKTVSLLTDKKLEEIPEVKVWVEIDLDLWEDAFELKSDHDDSEEDEHDEVTYHSITSEEFNKMLKKKDFFLVDTHVPEQEHIEWTDEFIPYNKVEKNFGKLPKDKNSKIVLYCRSWSMSRATAYILAEKWYTNVYDLVGGKIAYDEYKKSNNENISINSNINIVTLDAKRWEYNQKEIRVKKWDKLIIKVNNTDTTHWIAIPDMKLIWNNEIEVDTSKSWEFEFRCANYCWEGHQDMVWKIIIEP